MTELYFVRHGKTRQNMLHMIQGRTDFPLSERGKAEVRDFAERYRQNGLVFDVIYSSPLLRARESAEIFREIFGYRGEIIIDPGFTERDFGKAEGKTISEEVYRKIVADDFPGIEKSADIEKRVAAEAVNVAEENEGKKVLILSHSHAIKSILCAIEPKRKFTDPVGNVSLAHIVYGDGILSVLGANETPEEGSTWKK